MRSSARGNTLPQFEQQRATAVFSTPHEGHFMVEGWLFCSHPENYAAQLGGRQVLSSSDAASWSPLARDIPRTGYGYLPSQCKHRSSRASSGRRVEKSPESRAESSFAEDQIRGSSMQAPGQMQVSPVHGTAESRLSIPARQANIVHSKSESSEFVR